MGTSNLGLLEKNIPSTNPIHIVSHQRERGHSECTPHMFSYLSQTLVIGIREVVWKRRKITEAGASHVDSTSCASHDRNVPSTGHGNLFLTLCIRRRLAYHPWSIYTLIVCTVMGKGWCKSCCVLCPVSLGTEQNWLAFIKDAPFNVSITDLARYRPLQWF